MNKQYVVVRKTPASDVAVNHATRKRRVVILLLAYAAVSGAIVCFLPEHDTPVDYLVALPFLLLRAALGALSMPTNVITG